MHLEYYFAVLEINIVFINKIRLFISIILFGRHFFLLNLVTWNYYFQTVLSMTPQTVLLVLLLFFMSILAQHKKNHNSFEIKEGEHVNSGPCQRNTVKTSEFPLIDLILLSNLSNTDPTYWFCDPWIPWPAQIDFPRLAIYNFSTTLVSPGLLFINYKYHENQPLITKRKKFLIVHLNVSVRQS